MKLVILAATIGFVFGADDGATGGDCGRNSADDGDVACASSGEYCDLAQNAAGTNAVTAGAADNTGICAAKIVAGAACVADGDCVDGDCDASTCRLATGGTCAANGDCLDIDYCKAQVCATLEVAGATCAADADCAADGCQAGCGTPTCGTNSNADGALGGCCDGSTAVTSSDNYCLANIVTDKVADAGVCSVALAGADCDSGSCTATTDGSDDADVGACDATATTTDAATTTLAPTEAATDAPTDAPSDGGDSDSGSPAAIFYGLSMVTGAIAYLL